MKAEFFIARRYLKATTRGFISFLSGFAFTGVFIGVAALIITLGIMTGFHMELKKRILSLSPHVIVSRFFEEPFYPERIIEHLKGERDVIESSPFVITKCIVKKGIYTDGVVVKGLEQSGGINGDELRGMMVMGKLDLSPGHAVLGTSLAGELRVVPGDTIEIYSAFNVRETPFGLIMEKRKFEVSGVFDAGLYDYNTSFIFVPLRDLSSLLGLNGKVTGVEVKIKDPYRAREVAERIEDELGYPFRVTSWIELNRSLFSALKLEKFAMFLVLILIVVVASFSIIATLSLLVLEKTREIGILRSLGLTKMGVMRVFLMIGVIIGMMGTAFGVVFGLIVSEIIEKFKIINLPQDVYFISYLPVVVTLRDVLLIVGAVLLIVFLASIYPAYRASRLLPREALRYE